MLSNCEATSVAYIIIIIIIISLVPRLSPTKGEEESLVTPAGTVVDFRHLVLAVPIRLQNKTA